MPREVTRSDVRGLSPQWLWFRQLCCPSVTGILPERSVMYTPSATSLTAKLGHAMTTPEWRMAAKAQEDGWDEPEDVAAKRNLCCWQCRRAVDGAIDPLAAEAAG